MSEQGYLNKRQRIARYEIGGMVYTVTAEESNNAETTPLEIMRKLIERNAYKGYGEIGRTCCLQTDGGKKVC